MTAITKTSAKAYFQTGLYPTQSQFGDMIDSYLGLAESSAQAIATLNVTTKLSALAANITTVSATNVNVATVSAVSVYANNLIATNVSANAIYASNIIATTVSATVGGMLTGSLPNPTLSLSPITNSLSGDVTLNNISNFFDGPSIAQGTSGTWWAAGVVTVQDTAGAATFEAKLWDGTTVIAAATFSTAAINYYTSATLCGYLASPAANIKISVKDITSTSGKILFNPSGTSKDSTLSAIRIA